MSSLKERWHYSFQISLASFNNSFVFEIKINNVIKTVLTLELRSLFKTMIYLLAPWLKFLIYKTGFNEISFTDLCVSARVLACGLCGPYGRWMPRGRDGLWVADAWAALGGGGERKTVCRSVEHERRKARKPASCDCRVHVLFAQLHVCMLKLFLRKKEFNSLHF